MEGDFFIDARAMRHHCEASDRQHATGSEKADLISPRQIERLETLLTVIKDLDSLISVSVDHKDLSSVRVPAATSTFTAMEALHRSGPARASGDRELMTLFDGGDMQPSKSQSGRCWTR